MLSTSGFQRLNGLELWIHRFRDPAAVPSGVTVLLLHGFLDAGSTWDLVAPLLARQGHEVLAPDLRGFGKSAWIGAGGYYHFADYVADVAELVEVHAARRLVLVGHSLGGNVAAHLAGALPGHFERVALIEGIGPHATEPAMAIERMKVWLRHLREVPREPLAVTSMQEAIELLALHHPRVAHDVIESRAELLTRRDEQGRIFWAHDPLHRTTAPTPFNVETFRLFLGRIECPTLIVSGGPLGLRPVDEAERIACLQHIQRIEIPNAGHMLHWTTPAALARVLLRFIAGDPVAAS